MMYELYREQRFVGLSWGDSPMILTRDCVMNENYCRITSFMIFAQGNPCNILSM